MSNREWLGRGRGRGSATIGRVGARPPGELRSSGKDRGRSPVLPRLLLALGFGLTLTAANCPPDGPDEWDPWEGLSVDELLIVPDPIWVRIANSQRQFLVRALPRADCCGEIPVEEVVARGISVTWGYTSPTGAIVSVVPLAGEPLSAIVTIASRANLPANVDFAQPSVLEVAAGTHPAVKGEVRVFDGQLEAANDLIETAVVAGTIHEPDAGLVAGMASECSVDDNVAFVGKAPLGDLVGDCPLGRPGRAVVMTQHTRAGAGNVVWKVGPGDEPAYAPANNTLEGVNNPLSPLEVPVRVWSAVSTASPPEVSSAADGDLAYANYLLARARSGIQFRRLPAPPAPVPTLTPPGHVDVAGSGGQGDCEHLANYPALGSLRLADPALRVINVVYVDGIFSDLDPAEPGPPSGYAGFHCLKKAAWGSQLVFIDWSATGGSAGPTITTLAHELAHALGLRDDENRPGWDPAFAVGHTDHHSTHFDRTNLMYRHGFAASVWHPYRYDLSLGQIARVHLDANGWLQLATSTGTSAGPLLRAGLLAVGCQWQAQLDEPCPVLWDSVPGRP